MAIKTTQTEKEKKKTMTMTTTTTTKPLLQAHRRAGASTRGRLARAA
jgi:hypothetical protein